MSNKSITLDDRNVGGKGAVLIEGYLKKFKTMKKKYFVLRGESTGASARLEYFDSERKYRSGSHPKRTISLKTCFNINKRTDTKHKHVIALYNKDDAFCIVLESEQQLNEWLNLMLMQQSDEEPVEGELHPKYEHVWQVKLQDKGLGDSKKLVGSCYLCLSDQTLSLIKFPNSDRHEPLHFPLTHIRSCGGTEAFFYIEVGRQSVTGAGELWMLCGDTNIAKNMNAVILRAFTFRQKDDEVGDPHRKRSASATEANRPVGLLHRRTTHTGGKPTFFSTYSGSYVLSGDEQYCIGPKVCISPPPPPPSEVRQDWAVPAMSSLHPRNPHLPVPRPASMRRHSVSAVSSSSVLGQPAASVPPKESQDVPDGAPCTTTIVSHQRTKSCPVSDTSSAPLIVEPYRVVSQNHVGGVCHPDGDRRGSGGSGVRRPLPGKCSTGPRERSDSMPSRNRTTSEGTHKPHMRPQSVHVRGVSYSPPGPGSTDSAGSSLSIDDAELERFPHCAASDERVILEENLDEAVQWSNDPELEAERLDVYAPLSTRPPASLSLPIHSAPRKVSAPGVLHDGSYGSSPSDYLAMSPSDSSRRGRSGTSPSTSDYLPMSPSDSNRRPGTSPTTSDYLPMSPRDSNRRGPIASSPSAYMAMSPTQSKKTVPRTASISASSDYMNMSPADTKKSGIHGSSPSTNSNYMAMSPVDLKKSIPPANNPSANSDYMDMSPADLRKSVLPVNPSSSLDYMAMGPVSKSIVPACTSPSDVSDYMPMSPSSSSGRRTHVASMDYLVMSPADTHRGHSRGSSLAEDGYVPMAPAHSDDGYVDMDPVPMHRLLREDHHSDMSPGSSCSITSGTPSTDHFNLEKVYAYFTPSEEEDISSTDRPTRTYSFGSQPKAKLDITSAAEAARVRAFSVGTRPQTHKLPMRSVPPGAKCSSAPMLSGPWSGSRHHHDPMADHMEMDFSNSNTKRRSSWRKGISLIESAAHVNSSADSGYMDMSSKSPPKPSAKHLFSPPDGKSIGARLPKSGSVVGPSLKTVDECPKLIKPQKFPTTSSANLSALPNKHQFADHAYMDMTGKGNRSVSESKAEQYLDHSHGGSFSKLNRKSSVDNVSDYLPMSGVKSSSLPIDIASRNCSSAPPNQGSSTTSLLSSIRKTPKRKTRKKQERRGSKENVTTPTAIFPLSLNSPSSPKKAFPSEGEATVENAVEVDTVPLSRVLRVCSKENSPVPEDCAIFPAEEGDYAIMRPGQLSQRQVLPCKEVDETRSRLSSSGMPPLSPRTSDNLTDSDSSVRIAPLAKPETSRLRPASEPHPGVSRQVSTSSSSSTEVMSVKEGVEQLTYASLDLGSESEEPRSPRPSPSPAAAPDSPTYAQIDFNLSESRCPSQPVKKNIRH